MEEIKAGDIMIGNIVTVDNPQYHPKLKDVPLRVTGIQERSIQGEIECCVNLGHVNQKPNTYYDTYSQFLKFIHPIPLTEDILLKVGAKKVNHINGYIFWTFSDSKINKAHIDIYDYKTCYYGYSVNHCKHLHQLQNLLKSLTGNDLKIEV